jgi:cytoskeletal protein RodZ
MDDHASNMGSTAGASRSGLPASAEPGVSLGYLLRRAREQRGLTLQQIADTTRIPPRHLEALERDDLSVAPGGMYLRAEIRAYADAVGLGRDVALDSLHAAIEPPPIADAPPPRTLPPAARRASWRPVVAGVVVVVVAIVAWAAGRIDRATPPARSAPAPRTAAVAPASPAPANRPATAVATYRPERPASSTPAVQAATGTTGSDSAVRSSKPAAAASTRPAPPAVEPRLDVVTVPAGARVTVDGIGWGMTPVTIRYLPPGRKRLRVTRDGFAAQERVIDVTADRPRSVVRLTLRPLK